MDLLRNEEGKTMTKLYLCHYTHKGKKYNFSIPASSNKDAAARLKAVAQGTVDGELVFTDHQKKKGPKEQ
jgi:hypothetical protein